MRLSRRLTTLARARLTGYATAVLLPVGLTYLVFALSLPAYVFEHLVVLLVAAVAIPWGLGPAIVAAVVSVASDNVLLYEPIGSPRIGDDRDVIDLALFATVAVVVSELMRRAHRARDAAQDSWRRERQMREERDRLVATISHDLATPLTVLSGTVQQARRRGALTQADADRLLARLETAAARATSLVRSLSDAQELQSPSLRVDLSPCDLCGLVAPIVEMMARFSDRHQVALVAPPDPVPIRADRDRFQRVVENLLNNAIKYSPDGGPVEVSIAIDGSHAVLRVRDHGIGISDEALPRIFEHAYRAPEAAREAPGLGLGLSIARDVIGRHGGTITAAQAPGRGVVVSVRLPLLPVSIRLAAAAHDDVGQQAAR